MTLLLAVLAGVFVGLRSLTPPAVTAWAAHSGWLKLRGPGGWMGATPAVVMFTLLALMERVADTLPTAPSRTAPPGVTARIVMGGAGAERTEIGALVGVVGTLAGCVGGYQVRTRLVTAFRAPDFVIAVLEDLVAIGGSLWVVSRV